VIGGRYRLVRPLGKGGMASVWVGCHLGLHSEVALKFIDFQAGPRENLLSRFRAEAIAVARIRSPHVVRVLDYGYDDALDRPFLAMELLAGESLGERLERDGRLPVAETVKIVRQLCKGLARAHAAGVVHRDIKPDNIFLCPEDDDLIVKLLDFGVAKATTPLGAVAHHTTTGSLIGTPLYMSPEQALGGRVVDHRSDLYSLGTVAYRCLAGCPPFEPEGLGELIVAIAHRPVPPLSGLCPGLPPAFAVWMDRALEKDPALRFASAREMGEALLEAGAVSGRADTVSHPAQSGVRGGVEQELGSGPGEGIDRVAARAARVAAAPGRERERIAGAATFAGTATTRNGVDDPVELPLERRPLWPALLIAALALGGASALAVLRPRTLPYPDPTSVAAASTFTASQAHAAIVTVATSAAPSPSTPLTPAMPPPSAASAAGGARATAPSAAAPGRASRKSTPRAATAPRRSEGPEHAEPLAGGSAAPSPAPPPSPVASGTTPPSPVASGTTPRGRAGRVTLSDEYEDEDEAEADTKGAAPSAGAPAAPSAAPGPQPDAGAPPAPVAPAGSAGARGGGDWAF
jgi:eukaryotic-like serine/threonine-protein kinase